MQLAGLPTPGGRGGGVAGEKTTLSTTVLLFMVAAQWYVLVWVWVVLGVCCAGPVLLKVCKALHYLLAAPEQLQISEGQRVTFA